jgi:hypothetical protein
MDSQYKSTGTRLPDTIPATLGFCPRWQNPWVAEGRVDHQQREQCLSQISAENNKHWIPSKRRQLFAQSILSVQIKILLELIRITLFQEVVGPPGYTRGFLLSSLSLCHFVSMSLYLSHLTTHTSLTPSNKNPCCDWNFGVAQFLSDTKIYIGEYNGREKFGILYLPNVSHPLSLANLLLMICQKDC